MIKNKKIEYSKIFVGLSFTLFCFTLLFCITRDFTSIFDTAVYVSAIGSTGTLSATTLVWYLKKSQAEHVAGMESYMYKDVMSVQLRFIEGKLKLQKQYSVNEEEVNELQQNENPLNMIGDTQLSNMMTKLDSQMDDATASTETQLIS